MNVKLNLNDVVYVKLTRTGEEILRSECGDSSAATEPDADGVSKFQLHELFTIFGPHMYVGMSSVPFKSNSIILTGDSVLHLFDVDA
ncbi:hypothetical protein [Alicyclobacillus sp. ALC3]|uniref:hypothetical protein n=1 Tax=Alicyclobacillus sp. ALC3 TaxID=2796143 RepID=UPI0023792A54|nr:hypothetical protein [Alicyclobacillus sp. ALC3]WDL97809.1 hypothetical protein JC200_03500 [Alicyclobacillus sp. ALC3]